MSSETTPLITKPGAANGSSWVGRAVIAVSAVAGLVCVGFLAYHGDTLVSNSQFMLGTPVDALTVCASGRMQFHSFKKVAESFEMIWGAYEEDAYCTDTGAGGMVCGPTTAGALETYTVDALSIGNVLKGPRNSLYCLHEPEHFPQCSFDANSTQMTNDYAPFHMQRAHDDPNAYGFRIGSSGYCTSGARDIIHCDTTWFDKWERFNVTCA